MKQKFDPLLHAKIRELFPLEMGCSHVIEILSTEPLQYNAAKYTDIDKLSHDTFYLADDGKSYFVIGSLAFDEPVFFYCDPGVTFEQSYLTGRVREYKTRNPDLKFAKCDIKKELAQLVDLLKGKAS